MLFSAVRRACFGLLYALALEHGEEAGSLVVHYLLRVETRLVLGAVVLRPRTAVVEVAPAGRVRGRWHVSGDDHALALALLLDVLQQVDDLRLDRDVKRRDWLVTDDQARV